MAPSAKTVVSHENVPLSGTPDAIWIGKMNHAKRRVRPRNDEEREAVALLEHEQRDGVIHALYQRWCEEPKVKWKDSIKRVVGLPLVDEIGADT